MTLTFRATQVLDATLTLNLDIATIPAGSAAETTFKVRRWSVSLSPFKTVVSLLFDSVRWVLGRSRRRPLVLVLLKHSWVECVAC